MPTPTPAQVDAIVTRLMEAITNGTREPTAVLSADEHQTLLDLHINNVLAAGVVEQQLREHARTLTGDQAWSRAEINRISFRLYQQGAQEHRRRQAAIDEAANVVRMAAQMGGRRRSSNASTSTTGTMDSADMTLADSPRLNALGLLAQHRQGRVWYDTFHKRALCDWNGDANGTVIDPRGIDDAFIGRVTTWLHVMNPKLARLNEPNVRAIVLSFAREDMRNEPRDWLTSLTWDGVPRLASLMSRGFGAADTGFNRAVGRCWFVSMVARIMVAGTKVDTMPVLIGGQGLFKSQALEVLGAQWYRAASSGVDSKDFLQELHGALVFEIPELHSIVGSRHGTAKIKAVLSTRIDHFRLPFAYMPEDHARTAVIAGTTNNRDWHNDETGARRFWPVHVWHIDLPWLREWRAQFFAEALAYYRGRIAALQDEPDVADADALEAGKWWNVPADEQAVLMDAETARHAWHEIIEARLGREMEAGWIYTGNPAARGTAGRPTPWDGTVTETTEWGNTLTIPRIGIQWLGLSSETLGRNTAAARIIAGVMRSLGWETRRQRISGMSERPWVFVCPVPYESQNEQEQEVTEPDERFLSEQGRSDDADIPF